MAACKRLRELRKLLGLSMEVLSNAAGFTKQAYSMLENGRMAATPERMVFINRLLREARQERIEKLKNEIALLESFDIDESLYLKEAKV